MSKPSFFFLENPVAGILRNVCYSIILTFAFIFYKALIGRLNAEFLMEYFFAGIGLTFFGWGGERLWQASIAKIFPDPLIWYAFVTRFPFWIMLGGIGYTFALLIAKKIGLTDIEDMPVYHLFRDGMIIGCIYQFFLFIVVQKVQRKPVIKFYP